MTCLTTVRHFNVPDGRRLGGILLASNHQSYLDPLLIGIALDRPIHYLARQGIFRPRIFAWLLHTLSVHPVRLGRVDGAAVRTAFRLLRSGEPLLVFPEARRTFDGLLGEFQPGVGRIAAHCGVPVLPVAIEGAFECWPRSRAFPLPARVGVAFGEPIWPGTSTGHAMTRAVAAQVARMRYCLRRYLRRTAYK